MAEPGLVRQTPWPPQNQAMETVVPCFLSAWKLAIPSSRVNRSSTVPCRMRVGTLTLDR